MSLSECWIRSHLIWTSLTKSVDILPQGQSFHESAISKVQVIVQNKTRQDFVFDQLKRKLSICEHLTVLGLCFQVHLSNFDDAKDESNVIRKNVFPACRKCRENFENKTAFNLQELHRVFLKVCGWALGPKLVARGRNLFVIKKAKETGI